MIVFGDLFQLKPIFDGWIFQNYSGQNSYAVLAPSLWKENFEMYELIEIMRQKDDKQYAQMMNRLREGSQTEDDINALGKRCISATAQGYPQNAVHFQKTKW